MDANKEVEVNEAFTGEWQKHKCLWDVETKACKDRNAREYAVFSLSTCHQETRNYFFHRSILFGNVVV